MDKYGRNFERCPFLFVISMFSVTLRHKKGEKVSVGINQVNETSLQILFF